MKKILAYTLLTLFVCTCPSTLWGQKSKGNKKNATIAAAEQEIDNFDFLYADEPPTDGNDGSVVNQIMDEAFSHLGTRYRYGSKGPATFDCSGFTSYVFRQSDYAIGNSSRDQYAHNTPVKRSDMQRGDLVFFTSPRSGKGVGHVGIIVDVDPQTQTFTFIHASTNEGVKVSHSTDGYYTRRFVGIRRVF
ncbi:MAG: C40 family peptidase [Bacteroidaceae bacterium]|nr:C40 family peptidase [Bacteroidaceae bacterium]